MERDEYLEEISDRIRRGEPVGFLDAIAAINYQAKLKEEREQQGILARISRWFHK